MIHCMYQSLESVPPHFLERIVALVPLNLTLFSPLIMTLLQEGNFKEIFKTDEGNFVQNEEKL